MKKFITSVGLLAGTALLAAGLVHAKDDTKPSNASNKGTASTSTSAASKASGEKDKGAATQLDINSASEKELAALPKIGEAKAKAIIKARPFRSKDQLVDKKILSQDAYDSIKDQIIAKQDTAGKDKDKKK